MLKFQSSQLDLALTETTLLEEKFPRTTWMPGVTRQLRLLAELLKSIERKKKSNNFRTLSRDPNVIIIVSVDHIQSWSVWLFKSWPGIVCVLILLFSHGNKFLRTDNENDDDERVHLFATQEVFSVFWSCLVWITSLAWSYFLFYWFLNISFFVSAFWWMRSENSLGISWQLRRSRIEICCRWQSNLWAFQLVVLTIELAGDFRNKRCMMSRSGKNITVNRRTKKDLLAIRRNGNFNILGWRRFIFD